MERCRDHRHTHVDPPVHIKELNVSRGDDQERHHEDETVPGRYRGRGRDAGGKVAPRGQVLEVLRRAPAGGRHSSAAEIKPLAG